MTTLTLTATDVDGTWGEVYPEPETIWVRHADEAIYARIDGKLHVRVDVSLLGVDTLVDGSGGTALVWKGGVLPEEPAVRFDVLSAAQMGGGDDVIDLTGYGGSYPNAVHLQGEDGADVLWSGAGDDLLDGGSAADNLHGGAGADEILGGSGNDRLRGGAGDDIIVSGLGTDFVDGGVGDDRIEVSADDGRFETPRGGDGTDTLAGDGLAAIVMSAFGPVNEIEIVDGAGFAFMGDTGANILNFTGVTLLGVIAIEGGGNADTITGTDGDDVLDGGSGNDSLTGGVGDDHLIGGTGLDTLLGGDDDDLLDGGVGTDVVSGGDGDDTIYVRGVEAEFETPAGGAGTDTLEGDGLGVVVLDAFGPSRSIERIDLAGEALEGNSGINTLDLSAVVDLAVTEVRGRANNDTIFGNAQDNVLLGGSGGDLVEGRGGNDVIDGGNGVDILRGGGGDDSIDGGTGSDVIALGAGNDIIVVGVAFGADQVQDFVGGTDKVDIQAGWTFTIGGGGQTNLVVRDAASVVMGTITTLNGHAWTAADII